MALMDCSNYFAALSFDEPIKMEGSLAQKYFEANNYEFGKEILESAVYHSVKPENDVMFDSQKNKIYFLKSFSLFKSTLSTNSQLSNESGKPWNMSKSQRVNALEQIAKIFIDNADLLTQIEYFVRGIPIVHTKSDIKKIVEYYHYYSNSVSGICQIKYRNEDIDYAIYPVEDSSSLITLFGSVASTLAANKRVILLAERNMAVLIILLAQLHCKAGFSPEMIRVFPCPNVCELNKTLCPSITDFEDLSIQGTTMLVFESADLDSAVGVIANAVCSHKGLVPWAIKRILIQESVYNVFIAKLSQSVKKLKWNESEEYKPDDVTKAMMSNVDSVLRIAKDLGIRNIEMDSEQKHFKPLILLDSEPPYLWEGLSKKYPTPVVTTQPFRTTKEVLSMINIIPTWALSVWCNNISICNEFALASKFSNVWINNFGFITPEVSIKLKSRYIGGNEGLLINLRSSSPIGKITNLKRKNVNFNEQFDLNASINKVKTMQNFWTKTSKERKMTIFENLAGLLENNLDEFVKLQMVDFNITSEEAVSALKKSINYIRGALSFCQKMNNQCFLMNDKNMICTRTRDPLGLCCIREINNSIYYFTTSVIAATLYGNGVLYTANSQLIMVACKYFAGMNVPVVPISQQAKVDENESINMIWKISNDDQKSSSKEFSQTYQDMLSLVFDEEKLSLKFSNVKNIWTAYGETYSN